VHTQTQSCLVNVQLHSSQGFAEKDTEGVDTLSDYPVHCLMTSVICTHTTV